MTSKKHTRWTNETFKERVYELHPTIEIIGEYAGSMNKILCRCKIHNHYWSPIATTLLKNVGCPICGLDKISKKKKMSNEDFIKKLKEAFPNLVSLEGYINSHTPIKYKCLKCGNEFKRSPNNLFNSFGCECQQKGWLVIGVNDFKTKCPDLVQYLCDKSDAEKYSFGSDKKVKTKCPTCGHEREMKVCNLSSKGFNCSVCGDNVSFPNKFGRAFIEQLPVENIFHEKMLKIPSHKYRFDSSFEYQNTKYAVEFDGIQHYTYVGIGTLEEQKERDLIKNEYALVNDIVLIRIDCRVANGDYIKNSILNSKLNEIFDLSNIDWDLCSTTALKSLTREICGKYNSTKMSIEELSDLFHLSKSTISSRLKTGTKLGFTDYYSDENIKIRKKNGRKKTAEKLGKQIVAFYPNGDIYGKYESAAECARQMTKDIGKNFKRSSILGVCNHTNNSHCGFKYMFFEEYNSIN